jgi:hypothetical protein
VVARTTTLERQHRHESSAVLVDCGTTAADTDVSVEGGRPVGVTGQGGDDSRTERDVEEHPTRSDVAQVGREAAGAPQGAVSLGERLPQRDVGGFRHPAGKLSRSWDCTADGTVWHVPRGSPSTTTDP